MSILEPMTRWIALLMFVACESDNSRHENEPDDHVAPAATHVDAVRSEPPRPQRVPAKGAPRSAIASVPREDWPCRYVETLDESSDADRTHVETRWEYGSRTHCWIPVDLVGSRAIVGCPYRRVQRNRENKVEMPESFQYDATGHLILVKTIAAVFLYTWDGDLVRSVELRSVSESSVATYPFFATATGIEIKHEGYTERIDLDTSGHVVKYQHVGTLESSPPDLLTWKGDRLVRLQGIGTTEIEYQCKPAR